MKTFIHSLLNFHFNQQIVIGLIIVFGVVTAIQIAYYLVFYVPILRQHSKKLKTTLSKTPFNEPVSVVIAANNEVRNLEQFLPSVLEQDYSNFEVIVVNDRSSDDTETVLAILKQKYPHLRSTIIKDRGKLRYGKKLAITLGIKAAKYENILLTDADCKPLSKQWIQEMASKLADADMVLGYGPYFPEKGFLNKLIRYETSSIALQYMGYAKMNVAYMGIGRNIAYKKELFMNHKGFTTHAHLRSGDDDLFVNEVSSKAKIAFTNELNSLVYSIPKKNWKNWKRQKQRHLSTFKRYKKTHLLLLSLETYSRLFFYMLLPLVLYLSPINPWIWSAIVLRYGLFLGIHIKWNKKVNEPQIATYAPLFDLISPIIYFFLYITSTKRDSRCNTL